MKQVKVQFSSVAGFLVMSLLTTLLVLTYEIQDQTKKMFTNCLIILVLFDFRCLVEIVLYCCHVQKEQLQMEIIFSLSKRVHFFQKPPCYPWFSDTPTEDLVLLGIPYLGWVLRLLKAFVMLYCIFLCLCNYVVDYMLKINMWVYHVN